MTEPIPDVLTPPPLTPQEVHQLIGALYLEIDVLRRHVQRLRTYIAAHDGAESRPA